MIHNKMNALFLIFHGFDETNGISKKIRNQVKAFNECGLDMRIFYYDILPDGNRRWMANDKVVKNLGCGWTAKFRKRYSYKAICNYIRNENIKFVYIRSSHNANPFTIRMVREIKSYGIKVVMEIPTYPYDQEYTSLPMKLKLIVDRTYRYQLANILDKIITFSNKEYIFGKSTIQISNGIDFNAIPIKKGINDTTTEMNLLGVAEVHYWHGYDRLIKGLANYYQNNPDYKVYFHIVGPLVGEREKQKILPLIHEKELESYVILHGPLHGLALDNCFEQADFAIGSLGRHRSGITYIKTLKNREYAARGLAFVYSEIDDDFDNKPYVWKVPPDESPINIHELIEFQHSLKMSPKEIRESVKQLSWKAQMQKVIDEMNFE